MVEAGQIVFGARSPKRGKTVMKQAIGVFFFIALLSGCNKKNFVDNVSFAADGDVQRMSHLDVDIEAANVKVVRSENGIAQVGVDVKYTGTRPSYSAFVDGSTLHVKLDCSYSCEGSFLIRVPSDISAKIKLGAGNVQISELSNELKVGTGAGDIELSSISGTLDLKSGAGNIKGVDLSVSDCEANTGAGNISISMNKTPKRAKLRSGVGNVALTVPSSSYNFKSVVGIGHQSVQGITTDAHSSSSINVAAGVGNVTIRGV